MNTAAKIHSVSDENTLASTTDIIPDIKNNHFITTFQLVLFSTSYTSHTHEL
jgi:hypothetical protein